MTGPVEKPKAEPVKLPPRNTPQGDRRGGSSRDWWDYNGQRTNQHPEGKGQGSQTPPGGWRE